VESVERLVGFPLSCSSTRAGERDCAQLGDEARTVGRSVLTVARSPARGTTATVDRSRKLGGERRAACGLSVAVQFNECR
jgi:hypothetical protein